MLCELLPAAQRAQTSPQGPGYPGRHGGQRYPGHRSGRPGGRAHHGGQDGGYPDYPRSRYGHQ